MHYFIAWTYQNLDTYSELRGKISFLYHPSQQHVKNGEHSQDSIPSRVRSFVLNSRLLALKDRCRIKERHEQHQSHG